MTPIEQEAQKKANASRYTDQADIVKSRDSAKLKGMERLKKIAPSKDPEVLPTEDLVYIVVDRQYFQELYYGEHTTLEGECEPFQNFNKVKASNRVPSEGLERKALMTCSSLAGELFTFQPDERVLHLPISYPRQHVCGWGGEVYKKFTSVYGEKVEARALDEEKRHKLQVDNQMAHLREFEVTKYIVPWLKEVEEHVKNYSSGNESNDPLPEIDIPEDLLGMIHLYDVMLQLGIASYFHRPLIDALVLRMYQTNLQKCHPDTLEMTVCRFYSRGVPALDPVLDHFIRTYALRSAADRQHSKALKNGRKL
jgi:hypothetical protein